MSTKDLFDKGYSLNFLKNKSLTDYREDVESPRYIDAYIKKRERFFPRRPCLQIEMQKDKYQMIKKGMGINE